MRREPAACPTNATEPRGGEPHQIIPAPRPRLHFRHSGRTKQEEFTMRNKLWSIISTVAVLALLGAACSPAAPVTVVVTAPPVVQTAVVTPRVQPTAGPTPAPAPTPATMFAGLNDT